MGAGARNDGYGGPPEGSAYGAWYRKDYLLLQKMREAFPALAEQYSLMGMEWDPTGSETECFEALREAGRHVEWAVAWGYSADANLQLMKEYRAQIKDGKGSYWARGETACVAVCRVLVDWYEGKTVASVPQITEVSGGKLE